MLGTDFGENTPPLTEELEYPCENVLTKLLGRLAVFTGCCVITAEAVLEVNPCKVMMVAYGADLASKCVDSTADTCCPPIQPISAYRPFEMEYLEDSYTRKRR